MKKILVLLAVAFMGASAGYAQSAIELAKQQRELDKGEYGHVKCQTLERCKEAGETKDKGRVGGAGRWFVYGQPVYPGATHEAGTDG